MFGYEVDGLHYRMEDGLPCPTCTDGAEPDLTIHAMGLATNIEVDTGVWGETLCIGSADAAFKAMALYGKVTPETLDACVRGNGLIVRWPMGKGELFTAATCEWVASPMRGDALVTAVTCNVLDPFGGRPK